MEKREFDIIVFGASGYTGSFVVEELVKLYPRNSSNGFTWAVAGQNFNELDSVLQEVSELTGKDCSGVEKILADSSDLPSLIQMVSKCTVVITSVGPFRFLGENLVKACLAARTHLIEASGEVQYQLKMQLLYNNEAAEKGIYIVQACGVASVPADCGTIFLQNKFPGVLNSVEIFAETDDMKKCSTFNYASFRCLIYIHSQHKERDILDALLNRGPKFPHEDSLKFQGYLHYNRDVRRWCQFNFQCDNSVVLRSQQLLYEAGDKRPTQAQSYVLWPSFITAASSLIYLLLLAFLCQFTLFRSFIEKHPRIFTLGSCNPNKKIPRDLSGSLGFKFTIVGKGWPEGASHENIPTVTRSAQVSGYNPMYGASSVMLIQAAITILTEKDKMFGRGGVLPPGAAFAKTTFVDRMDSRGVSFKILPD